jgi:hypothetical protein
MPERAWKGRQGHARMREALLFSGLRRPAVRVVERKEIPGRQASGFGLQWQNALVIETSGNGRPYQTRFAEGWWRDLAEVRIDDESRVLRFLQQRGDPFGELEPGRPIVTSHWQSLITLLRQAASAWERPEVISRTLEEVLGREPSPDEGISAFRSERREGAAGFLRALQPEWTSQLSVTYDDLEPVVVAKSLAAYCAAAAAASLRAGLPMRRCAYCSSWFTLHHSKGLWCSASCRAATFNRRKSPHGLHQQDHDEEGNDPVAMPLERPRPGRRSKRAVEKLRDPKGSKGPRRPDGRNRKPRRRRSPKA